MLLCSVALLSACSSVGSASNAAKTEKRHVLDLSDQVTPLLIAENDVILIENGDLASMAAVLIQDIAIEAASLVIVNPPFSAILPDPVGAEPFRLSANVIYKQNGQLKNKFHPWYLFHPQKRC
jgi:ABC-type Fe3+-hydroxamate transport system substrate-binding protein